MNLIDKIKYQWEMNNSAIVRLVVINTLFSLLTWLLIWGIGNQSLFALPASLKLLMYRPYAIITYMFVHGGFFHLLNNMLILFFIGREFENLYGSKNTYKAYLITGAFAGIAFVVYYNIQLLFISGTEAAIARTFIENSILVGASGAVMGIVFALAFFHPNIEFFLYGIIRLKLWWIAVAYAIFDLLSLLNDNNVGGRIAHLFGGLAGILLLMYWKGKIKLPSFNNNKSKLTINKNPDYQHKYNNTSKPSQTEIDFILDKINANGYNSLSKEDKELLFRAKDN